MYGAEISDRIKELGYSVKTLASDVGISLVEMYRIKNDERNLINKETFLKIMKCLDLDPVCFGGFVYLDLKNKNDFYDGISFLRNIRSILKNDHDVKAKNLASYMGVSESFISLILSFKRTVISIDHFYLMCKFFNLNYQDYLVDKNIYPSLKYVTGSGIFIDDKEGQLTELIKVANELSNYDINKLINYANYLNKNKKLELKKKVDSY